MSKKAQDVVPTVPKSITGQEYFIFYWSYINSFSITAFTLWAIVGRMLFDRSLVVFSAIEEHFTS